MKQKGWAVEIRRYDGTTFFARGTGDMPAVWVLRNKKYAVRYKRELVESGFSCGVVPVEFGEPTTLTKKETGRT